MLIGLNRRFIFIANLKTASSAIEQVLKPICEIAIADAPFGKHLPFFEIETRFPWIFDYIPRKEFFIFGVMRDPVDFVLSLYNSHASNGFRILHPWLYTGAMKFDEFVTTWCRENQDQMAPQYLRFLDRDGHIAPDLIISYNNLGGGLNYVARRIGAPGLRSLPTINASNPRLSRDGLTPRQRDWIDATFADDQHFLERFCDRLLTPSEQEVWRDPISARQSPLPPRLGFAWP
jgi:hypothetical protein